MVQIQNDNEFESDEYFLVQLISTSPRVSAGQARANVTIMDDDSMKLFFDIIFVALLQLIVCR